MSIFPPQGPPPAWEYQSIPTPPVWRRLNPLIILGATAALAAVAIVIAALGTNSRSSSPQSAANTENSSVTGSFDEWIGAVCLTGKASSLGNYPVPKGLCRGFPSGGGFTTQFFIYQFSSPGELATNRQLLRGGYSYAVCQAAGGSVTAFVSDVSGIGQNSDAVNLTEQALSPLADYSECVVTKATPGER